jgi:hypothetical protein
MTRSPSRSGGDSEVKRLVPPSVQELRFWPRILEQVSRLHVIIQCPRLELADPDSDQLPGNVVTLGQRVQRLTGDEFPATCRLNATLWERCLAMASFLQKPDKGGQINELKLSTRRGRSTAVNCVASSMPAATLTTAPASLTSITGAARGAVAGGMASVTVGTNERTACHGLRSFCRRCRHPLPHRASPIEYLLGTNLPAPSHLGHTPSWNQGLRDNLCLLSRRPATPAARSGQQLNPPKFTLRVIARVKHKDSSKPFASSKSSTSRTAIKEGRQSSAYDQPLWTQ